MTDSPTVDVDLARAVRSTTALRTGFYVVVLLIALGGQVSGAMEALDMQWYVALPAVGALELGGMVVLANADVRRRLGEHATLSRLLSAAIAGGAVAFNWLAHANHLEGGFYGGMSLLGYLVWLMNTENKRRDRLRAKRQLPPTPPAYGLVRWLRHPWATQRARALALADARLGLYGSVDAAAAAGRTERRQRALSKVLHRKIRQALDGTTADIAVAVYDLDEIARRLAERADYDGLTALIAADLEPARIAAGNENKANKRPTEPAPAAPVSPPAAPLDPAPEASTSPEANSAPRRIPLAELDAVWTTIVDRTGESSGGDANNLFAEVTPPALSEWEQLVRTARMTMATMRQQGAQINRDSLGKVMRQDGTSLSGLRLHRLWREVRTDANSGEQINGRTSNLVSGRK